MQIINSASQGGALAAIQVGPTASRPASGGANNIIYQCTDSPYEFLWNGSAWLAFAFGFLVVPPNSANFTQINTDRSTLATTNGGIMQSVTAAGFAEDMQILGTPLPATPYYMDVAFLTQGNVGNGGIGIGIGAGNLRSNALEFQQWLYDQNSLLGWSQRSYNNYNTDSSVNASLTSITQTAPMMWMRIHDDGTNLTYFTGPNGYIWTQQYTHLRGSFLTPAYGLLVVSPYQLTSLTHWLHFSFHT